ncbi:tyrosine-type recombinase/integrase [Mycolicibacterium pulveris]|uniref:tyrosine-type recombinase/integrase n=1 Tax=Mycolicibacterium pulveris TaxID=36813 RepID=UPI003CEF8202
MTYGLKVDAEGWLADERRALELDRGGIKPWIPPAEREAARWVKGETVAEYGTRWIAERAGLKPRTRSLYESQFRLHIKPVLGEVPIRLVTTERVRAWYARLDGEHARRNAQTYQLLHAIMATAVKDGLLPANPCQIERVMNGSNGGHRVMPTYKEVAALAAAMPEKYRAMVLLAAWCGLRHGEVAELRRKDISEDYAVVTVARAMTYRSGQTVIGLPKSGKARTVVVPPHIREDLKHHLKTHVSAGDEALLFSRDDAGRHLTDTRDAGWRNAVKTVGKDGLRFHDLRHFAGTMATHVGASTAETMRRIGHSTYKAAMIYQAALDERDYEIAARLSKLAEGE